jgi:hypothetical protein
MQVSLANVMINPINTALENGIEILGGVDVNEAAEAGIFVC